MNIQFKEFIVLFLVSFFWQGGIVCAQERVSEQEINRHAQTVAAALDSIENDKEMIEEFIQKESFVLPEKTPYISMANHNMVELVIANQDPIEEVLNQFSILSGMDIVFDEEIKTQISLFLQDVSFYDAFRIIVGLNRLAYVKQDNVYHVMTEDLFRKKQGYDFKEDMQVRMYKLDYAEPNDMAEWIKAQLSLSGKVVSVQLPQVLVKVSGSVEDRFVIVIDKAKKIKSLSATIKELDVFRVEKEFVLKYGDIRFVSARVKDILTDVIGQITVDMKANTFSVKDRPEKLESISKLVTLLDKNDKELVLNIRAFQILLNEDHQAGVDWRATVSDCREINGQSDMKAQSKELILGVTTDEDSDVLMNALNLVGEVETLDGSEIITKSGRLKEFQVEPLVQLSKEEADVKKNDQISFYVKAYILAGDIVRVIVSRNQQVVAEANEYFQLDEESNSSSVELMPEEAIIIGGLMQNVEMIKMHKTPILGDVPFLKKNFTEQEKDNQQSEIVIFISSHVKIKE